MFQGGKKRRLFPPLFLAKDGGAEETESGFCAPREVRKREQENNGKFAKERRMHSAALSVSDEKEGGRQMAEYRIKSVALRGIRKLDFNKYDKKLWNVSAFRKRISERSAILQNIWSRTDLRLMSGTTSVLFHSINCRTTR